MTQSLTFGDVERLTWGIAGTLRKLGLVRGSRVAIYTGNSTTLYVCMLGLFRLGAVWIPINPANGATENAEILDLVDADAVLFVRPWAGHVDLLKSRRGRVMRMLEIDENFGWLVTGLDDTANGFDAAVGPDRDPSAVVSIHCTGGTTGRPKGVPFTNLMWETMIATFHTSIPTLAAPVHLAAAPLSHGAGAVALCLLAAGATQVVLPKFEAEAVLETIEREHVTHLFLPPTAVYMLLSSPTVRSRDLSSMRCLLYAAAPMAEERLREALEIFGPVMVQTYGQTEAPLICACLSAGEHVDALRDAPQRLRSCGRPTMLTEVTLLDDEGGTIAPGAEGEIAVRGSLVMTGYIQDASVVDARRSADEWHRTGDVGRFDDDGYLYVVDRKKDMIISGGFNVYPSAIEQVLFAHTSVQDCAVIGVPDDKWGEAVKAIIQLKPGCSATADELLARCREALGPIRTPKSIEFWAELPRSPVGKVLKTAIRDRFWKHAGRKI